MTWNVRVTDIAYRDLREAAAYMRDSLESPKAAKDFVAEFEAKIALLETFPEGRPPVADFELARMGYRWCPVGSFMLFYTADRASSTVTVERLLYGARDWRSLVGKAEDQYLPEALLYDAPHDAIKKGQPQHLG